MVQICFMYFAAFMHKKGKEWTEKYTATFYALQVGVVVVVVVVVVVLAVVVAGDCQQSVIDPCFC